MMTRILWCPHGLSQGSRNELKPHITESFPLQEPRGSCKNSMSVLTTIQYYGSGEPTQFLPSCTLVFLCWTEKTKPFAGLIWGWHFILSVLKWWRVKSLFLSVLKALPGVQWVQTRLLIYVHFSFCLSFVYRPYLCGEKTSNTRNTTLSLTPAAAIFKSCDCRIVSSPGLCWTIMSPGEISIFVTWAENGW